MAIPMKMSITFFTLLLAFSLLSFSTSSTGIGVSKEQIACTMCEPPPLPESPPPPSPPPSPPPPSPVLPKCPPPPSPTPPPAPESPQPYPPTTPAPEYPPNESPPYVMPPPPMIRPHPPRPPMQPGGGGLYAPPGIGTNPVPYFLNSNNLPTPTSSAFRSIQWKLLQPIALSILLAITFLCVFSNNS